MQLVYDEYLVDHCWIVRCDHHLDDRLSLYHVSDDRVGSVNNIHWSVATVDDIVDHARQPTTVFAIHTTTEASRCPPRQPTTVCAIHTTTEAWRCPPRFSGSCLRHKPTTIHRRQIVKEVPLKKPQRPGQSSTTMQIFTPIGARYLSTGKDTYLCLYGTPLQGGGLLSHVIHV